jgi:hypothetical protein
MDTHASPRIRPSWLPAEGHTEAVPAGKWWDCIAISGPLGDRVLDQLHDAAPGGIGPVIRDCRSRGGRTYFLVPAGAARHWRERGTDALGCGAYIGMPVSLDVPTCGLSWASRPDTGPVRVDVGLLRVALAAARGEVQ